MAKYYDIKGEPFQYKGVCDVRDCKTSEEVMIKAGLNFHVDKCEVFAKMQAIKEGSDEELDRLNAEIKGGDCHIHGSDIYRAVPNAYSTFRTDFNMPLGIVKQKYNVVQNIEAFKFFDNAIGTNKAIWQTAGSFNNGACIFVSCKLPQNIMVKGSDPVDNYLVFTNTHDGSSGVKVLFTPIRVICKNTLTAAVRTSKNFVSFRHTASVHDNIATAQELLGICAEKRAEVDAVYQELAKIKVTDEDVMQYIVENNLSTGELQTLKDTGHTAKELCYRNYTAFIDSGISTRKLNIITDTWDYYNNGPGQDLIAGTAWGAVNSITGYYSNVDNAVGSKRMNSILYGDKANKIQSAFAMADAIV